MSTHFTQLLSAHLCSIDPPLLRTEYVPQALLFPRRSLITPAAERGGQQRQDSHVHCSPKKINVCLRNTIKLQKVKKASDVQFKAASIVLLIRNGRAIF